MQDRREFLYKMSLLTGSIAMPWNAFSAKADRFGSILPLRKLGNTGEKVTMLGVGGFHIGWTTERDAEEVIETAMELGIRFFDTAHNYAKGVSETRYGKFLTPNYRDQIFLMTKSQAVDYKSAKQELELSLKRLNVDQLDLWQMHSLFSPEDVDTRVKNGVLNAVEEALKEGKIRYAGFTCHKDPHAMVRMLEQSKNSGLFSCAQMPVNVVDESSSVSFTKLVMPLLSEQKMGILAMKTLADGRFFNSKKMNDRVVWESDTPLVPSYLSVEEAMQFVWSLPISVLITGAENATLLREKVDYAKRMGSLSNDERKTLLLKLADFPNGIKVEYYKG